MRDVAVILNSSGWSKAHLVDVPESSARVNVSIFHSAFCPPVLPFLLPLIDLSPKSIAPVEMAANPTAMMLAWEEAFKKFKASMPAKDLKHIQQPTAPGDIISHLNKWMSSKETTSGKLASLLQDRTARLQRFAGAIDQLAQGMPQPACLIWGSMRYVLTVRSTYTRV